MYNHLVSISNVTVKQEEITNNLLRYLSLNYLYFFIFFTSRFEYGSGVFIFGFLMSGFHNNLVFCLFCHRMLDSRDQYGLGETRKWGTGQTVRGCLKIGYQDKITRWQIIISLSV